jgi:hypothetical protein
MVSASGGLQARCFQPNPWTFSACTAAIGAISRNFAHLLPAGPGLGKPKPCFLCIDGPRRAGDKPAE